MPIVPDTASVNQIAEAKQAEAHASYAAEARSAARQMPLTVEEAKVDALLAVSHELTALRHTLLQLFDSRS